MGIGHIERGAGFARSGFHGYVLLGRVEKGAGFARPGFRAPRGDWANKTGRVFRAFWIPRALRRLSK